MSRNSRDHRLSGLEQAAHRRALGLERWFCREHMAGAGSWGGKEASWSRKQRSWSDRISPHGQGAWKRCWASQGLQLRLVGVVLVSWGGLPAGEGVAGNTMAVSLSSVLTGGTAKVLLPRDTVALCGGGSSSPGTPWPSVGVVPPQGHCGPPWGRVLPSDFPGSLAAALTWVLSWASLLLFFSQPCSPREDSILLWMLVAGQLAPLYPRLDAPCMSVPALVLGAEPAYRRCLLVVYRVWGWGLQNLGLPDVHWQGGSWSVLGVSTG